ncbi:MAG: efflux RND transporter periplasmic adaptor subunit [Kiloniellales bacterium]
MKLSDRSKPSPGKTAAPSGATSEAPALDGAAASGLRMSPQSHAASRRRRRTRRWPWLVLVLVIAAGAGLGWHFWSGGGTEAPAVLTTAVVRGDIEDATMALGTLQPLDYVDVGVQVSGQLRALYVDLGDEVEAGELLAEIDPTIYEARVAASRAQLGNLKAQMADRQAQLLLARQQLERQTALMRADATSQDALQGAQAAMTSASAQVEALKAQIENAESGLEADEANLGYSRIYAPMSGTVVEQSAKQGQTLNTNQQAPIILRIADLSTMTVTTQVSEADIGRLAPGMPVYFTTLGRPERRWESRLRKILPTPEVVNNVVLYNALFDVPNPTGELMTQMTTQVFFVSARAQGSLLVPIGALQEGGGPSDFMVQVRKPDGTLEERPVQVGIINRVSAEILEGLEEGEQVVIGTERPGTNYVPRFLRTPRLS